MSRKYLVAIVFSLSIGAPAPAASFECIPTAVVTDFYEKDVSLQKPDFSAYNLEDQYEIFIYGNICIEPPKMQLAVEMARRGEDAVNFLEQKLGKSDDVGTIISIIRVFSFMTALDSYDVAGDDGLMTSMQSAVNGMEDGFWKRNSQDLLDELAANRKSGK